MRCAKCGSENVVINTMQVSARTSTKKKGCLYSLGRFLLICCTCGLWLVFGKKKATSKTKFEHETVAVCQNCGNRWTL